METQFVIVLITAPSEEVGRRIAARLVERRLAAGANIVPDVNSIYRWRGEVHDESEVMLVVQTRQELFERLVPVVEELHPYEVPEIIALPIVAGTRPYLAWIREGTVDHGI